MVELGREQVRDNWSGDTLTQVRPHLLIVACPVNLCGHFHHNDPHQPLPGLNLGLPSFENHKNGIYAVCQSHGPSYCDSAFLDITLTTG